MRRRNPGGALYARCGFAVMHPSFSAIWFVFTNERCDSFGSEGVDETHSDMTLPAPSSSFVRPLP